MGYHDVRIFQGVKAVKAFTSTGLGATRGPLSGLVGHIEKFLKRLDAYRTKSMRAIGMKEVLVGIGAEVLLGYVAQYAEELAIGVLKYLFGKIKCKMGYMLDVPN